jgi:universal stress protein E
MVKNVRDWSGRRVLGAVNLGSHDLGHIKLNNQIISEAQRFAHGFGAEAHFAMAYPDQNRAPDPAEVARICGVEPARVHLRHGNAAAVIRLLAEELAADLIIIGTVARSGLMGTVVGNTAERVLDDTASDVLVLN